MVTSPALSPCRQPDDATGSRQDPNEAPPNVRTIVSPFERVRCDRLLVVAVPVRTCAFSKHFELRSRFGTTQCSQSSYRPAPCANGEPVVASALEARRPCPARSPARSNRSPPRLVVLPHPHPPSPASCLSCLPSRLFRNPGPRFERTYQPRRCCCRAHRFHQRHRGRQAGRTRSGWDREGNRSIDSIRFDWIDSIDSIDRYCLLSGGRSGDVIGVQPSSRRCARDNRNKSVRAKPCAVDGCCSLLPACLPACYCCSS